MLYTSLIGWRVESSLSGVGSKRSTPRGELSQSSGVEWSRRSTSRLHPPSISEYLGFPFHLYPLSQCHHHTRFCKADHPIAIGISFTCIHFPSGIRKETIFTMPHTEKEKHHSFGRIILSFGRGQVPSMDTTHSSTSSLDSELESFQRLVSDHFAALSSVHSDDMLTFSWLHNLLDAFVSCHDHFMLILSKNKLQLSNSPMDKFTSDYFERSVKALDICNTAQDGIGVIQQWEKHLEIVVCALDPQNKTLSEGKFRRAKKALMEMALDMLDDKDTRASFSQRNRSYGGKKDHQRHPSSHSRSLSWSVSPSWSASKQLHSIANHLIPPRGSEISFTNGLVVPVFTMSFVLLFVLWVLVAALPSQDRNLQIHFTIPRQFPWGNSIGLLHEQIMEASKKERNNSHGLLKEIIQTEKCSRHMTSVIDSAQFPLSDEQKRETEQGVAELAFACESLKIRLQSLERQVRDIFRKIMNCRIEGLGMLDKPNHL